MKLMTTKNAGKLLAILMAMRMWRYNAWHIAQWHTSMASLEATGCCYQVSAGAILLWWLPSSSIWLQTQKHYQNTTFS
jgi:hypothetical protein